MRNTNRLSAGLTMLAASTVTACGDSSAPIIYPPPPPLPAFAVFPADNPWSRDISADDVDPNSDNLIAACGATRELHPDFGTTYLGVPWGIPYITVTDTQPRVNVSFTYADESDPGPYPIPPNAPIEG